MAESETHMLNPEYTRKCLADTEAMLARLNADARGDDGFRYLERLSMEKMRDQLAAELAAFEDEFDEDVAKFMMEVFDAKERGDYVEMIAKNSVEQRLNGEFVVMDQKELIDEAHRIDRQWDRLHGKNSRHG